MRVGPSGCCEGSDLVVVQGSCRLPCFMMRPGTVNSFTRTVRAVSTENQVAGPTHVSPAVPRESL
jgi:hypothetical protein